MAEDPKDPVEDPKDPVDPEPDPEPDPDPDPKDPDPKDKGKDLDPEAKRAIQRRDRALKERDAAKEEARKLREKYEPEKADPVKVANRRLVTAESRVVMTAAGITEKEDQAKLAGFLGLDDVAVDEDGTVDSDAIQERLETLTGILKKVAGAPGKRTPRVDTRDRGGEKAAPKDAQAARRREMLGYR